MKRSVRLPTRRARVMPPISIELTTGGLPLCRVSTSPSTFPILTWFLSTSCLSMMSRARFISSPAKDLEWYRHDRQDEPKGDDSQDCNIAKPAIGVLLHETPIIHEEDEGKNGERQTRCRKRHRKYGQFQGIDSQRHRQNCKD